MANEIETTPKGAWAVFVGYWLVAVTCPMNQFKVTTMAPEIMQYFGIAGPDYGWCMSVFTICGIILAFPAAGIVMKLGMKRAFLITAIASLVGTLIGAVAETWAILLFSRVIEGLGMGFAAICAPTAVTMWFPASKRSLPIGVCQAWVPLGSVVSMNLGPAIYGSFGLKGMWWVCVGFCVIALIVFLITWKEPPGGGIVEISQKTEGAADPDKYGALKMIAVWVIALGMFVFAMTCTGTTTTYWALYMRTEAGIDPQSAAFIASLCTAIGLVGTPLGGMFADRIKRVKPGMLIGWAVVIFFFIFAFNTTDQGFLTILGVVNGIFQGWVVVTTTTALTEVVANKAQIPMAMATMNFGRQLGNFVGGFALGYLTPSMGWAMGSWVLSIPAIVIVAALVLIVTRGKVR